MLKAGWSLHPGHFVSSFNKHLAPHPFSYMTPSAIYLHVPFCRHRCAYCDFNTYAGQEAFIPAYVDALIREIEFCGGNQPGRETCASIFLGGGTPSLLEAAHFERILHALRTAFDIKQDAEITIEANPGTLSAAKLAALRQAGINRISLGVQSANTEELRMLERIHDFLTVIRSVADARQAGFNNLNLDLIYGLPQQGLSSWKTTLARVLELQPEHISAYALTLEHGTPFGRWSERGLLAVPNPDLAAEMYEYTEEILASAGYEHYEISNWAIKESKYNPGQRDFRCAHNLQYWRSLPYLAFGAGAHGYTHGYRYSNLLRIKTYIERLTQAADRAHYPFPLTPATVNYHRQTLQDDISDYMINNLRLVEAGVSHADFEARFGRSLLEVFPAEIAELTRLGLLGKKASEFAGNSDAHRLTERGRLLGNQVFLRFV